jgi:hypothetical protein
MEKSMIENAEVKGDRIYLNISVPLNRLLDENFNFTYDIREPIKNKFINVITDNVVKMKKEEIIKDVLKDVNWPDVVRSEIAQKIIAEIGRKY